MQRRPVGFGAAIGWLLRGYRDTTGHVDTKFYGIWPACALYESQGLQPNFYGQPNSAGLQPTSDQPNSNGLQPTSDDLQPN